MRQLPPSGASEREIAFAVHELINGRGNNTGKVTLTASATATVVQRTNGNVGSAVLLFPMTANAAAAVTTTYVTQANVTSTGFTITHASNAQTDRTFFYIVVGG